MKIRLNDLQDGDVHLSFSLPAGAIPVLEEISTSEGGEFVAPLAVSLRAVPVDDLIAVTGTLVSRIRLRCSRCLKDIERDHQARISLTYCRQMDDERQQPPAGDLEHSPEDIGLIPFTGDTIDLTEGLAEQVVLSIPYRALCSDECKGLCATCGADLNNGDCGCSKTDFDPRFEALRGLKLPKG